MDKNLEVRANKDIMYLLLSLLAGFIAQLMLYLSKGVDLAGVFSSVSLDPQVSLLAGILLYLLAGVLFVIAVRENLQAADLFKDINIEKPLFKNRKAGILILIALIVYLISMVLFILLDKHVTCFLGMLVSFILASVAFFIIDGKNLIRLVYTRFDLVFAVLVTIIAFFLYTYNLDVTPFKLNAEEAVIAINVRSIVEDGLIHLILLPGFLLMYLHQLSFDLFGYDVFGLRFVSALFAVLSIPVFYFLVRELFSIRVSVVATLLLAFYHPFIAMARNAVEYSSGVFVLVLVLYLAILAVKQGSYFYMFLAGLAAGLGYYLHQSAAIAVFILLVYLFVMFFKYKESRKALLKYILLAVVAFILFVMPFMLKYSSSFVAQYNFAPVFSDQNMQHMKNVYQASSVLVVLAKNAGYTIKALNSESDNSYLYGNNKSMLDFFSAVFFILAIFAALYMFKDDRYYLIITGFLIVALSGGVFDVNTPRFFKLVMLLPFIAMLVAIVIMEISDILVEKIKSNNVLRYANLLLVYLLTIVIILLNFNNYFNYYIKNNIADVKYHIPTMTGYHINTMGGFYNIYLVNFKSDPVLYDIRYETVKFLLKDNNAIQITDALHAIPLQNRQNKDVLFIFFPDNYEKSLKLLNQTYPSGKFKTITSDEGKPVLGLYRVKKEKVNSMLNNRV
jgi:4-amino-4-deoxy-L-arabinose transferase-like glycosyltransferase